MKQTGVKVVATNRQARHRYTLLDTYECGLVLTGSEVKSLREAKVQLTEAWGSIDAGEAWLHGMHIAPYTHAQEHTGHQPVRPRKLLLQVLQRLAHLVVAVEQYVVERFHAFPPLRY